MNITGEIRRMRLNSLLALVGLSAACLLAATACNLGVSVTPPENETGPPAETPLRGGEPVAFLSADRTILIRDDVEAGHATLTVRTDRQSTFRWSLDDPDHLLQISADTPLSGADATNRLTISGVVGDPGPDGSPVVVTVIATEQIGCPECVDGESATKQLTLVVRRPAAPLAVSLAAVEGSTVVPGGTLTLRATISGGTTFPDDNRECAEVGLRPSNNGRTYCVNWSVSGDDDLRGPAVLTVADLPETDANGNVVAVATYRAPTTAVGNVVFTVNARDAAGNQDTANVPVVVRSKTPLAFAEASAKPSVVAPGDKVRLTASATGGESPYQIEFTLVTKDFGSLAGVACSPVAANQRCADFTAPSNKVGPVLIRVSLTDAVGAAQSTTIPLTVASREALVLTATFGTPTLQLGGFDTLRATIQGGTPPYTVCFGVTGTAGGTVDGGPAGDCGPIDNLNNCTCTTGTNLQLVTVDRTYRTANRSGADTVTVKVRDSVGAPATAAASIAVSDFGGGGGGGGGGTGGVTLALAVDHPAVCASSAEKVKITATATGGTDNQFTFQSAGTVSLERLSNTLAELTYTAPASAGTQRVTVTVTSAGKSSATQAVDIVSRTVASCDDVNVCTNDSCSFGDCIRVNIADGTGCNDNNACTLTDSCLSGVCAGSNPKVCTALDPCHDVGVCNPGTGDCSDPPKGNGATCEDGNRCTSNDVCTNGVCVGGAPPNCDDASFCTTDSCNPAIGCVHSTVNCDDGSLCTADSCNPATGCVNTAISCNDTNPCTDDSCSPATGCVFANNAVACSDNNACTDGDVCAGGACVPGGARVCNDGSACTTDSCNPIIGCVTTPVNCDDNSLCTTDSCNPASGCVNTLVSCDDGSFCTTDSCNPALGCVHSTVNCDDGSLCTTDSCNPATGCANTTISCNDFNLCTTDSCNPATGCVFANNAAVCSDNNACTVGDVCSGGACVPGAPLVCDDGNVCTNDFCDAVLGCRVINNNNPCSDGNACTTNDTCNGGACVPGSALVCNDANVCTNDSCNPATGCVFTNNAAACDDGVFCNGGDTCGGGTCSIHAGSPCGAQACKESTDTCVECLANGDCGGGTPFCNTTTNLCVECLASVHCNDANVCTTDVCDAGGACVNFPNSAACSDGLFCNGADTCSGGACSIHAGDPCPGPDVCDEVGDACVACLNNGDCGGATPFCETGSHTCVECLNAGHCNDAVGCTNDTCVGGTCVFTANDANCPDDGAFCNGTGSCHAVNDCVSSGDPCAVNEFCNEATDTCDECQVDGDCDDLVACTDDTCVGGTCVFTANDANCPDDGLFCNGTESCHAVNDCVSSGDPCAVNEFCNEATDACDECQVDGDCDDLVACTDDTCVGGTCVFTANNANCPDNGLFCDGTEFCDPVNDCDHTGDPCTFPQVCDEPTDSCL